VVGDFNDYIFNKTLYLNEAVFGALVTGEDSIKGYWSRNKVC